MGGRRGKVAEHLGGPREVLQRPHEDLGKKVQCQLLPGWGGGATGSQAEPGCVEDERVHNENLDDGVAPDKEMGEAGGGGGGNDIEQCDGDGEGGGGGWR